MKPLKPLRHLAAALALLLAPDALATPTELELRDAVLGKRVLSPSEQEEYDLNDDGEVNVADLVFLLLNLPSGASLFGEHVGIMIRDGGDANIAGQSSAFGVMPLKVSVASSKNGITGAIDNGPETPDPGAPFDAARHYSLYFPAGVHPVEFRASTASDLEFEVRFQSVASTIAPNDTLERTIVFQGDFVDQDARILSGTYTETIAGLRDVRGGNVPIELSGTFSLAMNIVAK